MTHSDDNMSVKDCRLENRKTCRNDKKGTQQLTTAMFASSGPIFGILLLILTHKVGVGVVSGARSDDEM